MDGWTASGSATLPPGDGDADARSKTLPEVNISVYYLVVLHIISCLLTGTSTYNITDITKSVATTPNGYSYEFIVTATVHAMPTTI